MGRLIAQRLLAMLPLLLIVSFLTFSLTAMLPGDPADLILGDRATEAQYRMVHERLGLDQPFLLRYVQWLQRAVLGDLGTSFFNSVRVMDAVAQRIPATVSLTLASVLISIVVGLSAGVAAALRPRSWIDRLATFGATIGQAIPNFWFGILLAGVFAVNLRWFPATGYTPFGQSPLGWLSSITLPALALGLSTSAAIARQVRSAMVGVLQQDYVRAALAQGLSRRRVIFKHALKNALIPVVTVLSFQVTVLLGGALIVEHVFAINGIGSLAVAAVRQQDIPMIQGIVLVLVMIVMAVQLCTDILYGLINPKARPA
ncbi:peptide/nickel transport system permease protein [Lutimaribacter pacificus]|uniref:Peptide/nickel transport system permease protein n=1 Tax=Lutimaribacter pacificus TaxID=391948 RepID=A0A1H0N740_9RHOB|nr:ABC transporter permease [Lutimaribacter pacificus]SDO88497.1 peptide/nickel transport system permease protein [Lutimaribacter pacificus]SHK86295.1 peptide/nickel transport system permease protein [Lutimaribacter pacificus]